MANDPHAFGDDPEVMSLGVRVLGDDVWAYAEDPKVIAIDPDVSAGQDPARMGDA